MNDHLIIAGRTFHSRLFMGTGKYGDHKIMEEAVMASGTEMITVALRRINGDEENDDMLSYLRHPNLTLLPNTSGARDAKEAIFAAHLAQEALETNWLKLEIHPDAKHLMPDAVETLKATEQLAREGFIILPYVHADPVLCKRLEDAGASAVMPLGSPIGSNKGLKTYDFLQLIIEQSNIPVIVDAGIGAPSHSALAMEIGADAVLINTAIAIAGNPVIMAEAFKKAVEAGRMAFIAKLAPIINDAEASSPLTNFLYTVSPIHNS